MKNNFPLHPKPTDHQPTELLNKRTLTTPDPRVVPTQIFPLSNKLLMTHNTHLINLKAVDTTIHHKRPNIMALQQKSIKTKQSLITSPTPLELEMMTKYCSEK